MADNHTKLIGPLVTISALGALSRTSRRIASGPAKRRRVKKRKVTVRKITVSPKPKIKKRVTKTKPKTRKSRRKAR